MKKSELETELMMSLIRISELEAALRRVLKDGCLDPRLLCVLQANQALNKD